jgi:hypothetical protein
LGNSTKLSKVEIVESIQMPLIKQDFLFVYGVKNLKRLKTYFEKEQHGLVDRVFEDFDNVAVYTDAYVEYYREDNGEYYLSFVLRKVDENILGTIVHEVVHLIQHVRKTFFSGKMEVEFEAYLTEWTFNEICKILKEHKII